MDEKMFELMSKMYAEMQEGFARTDQKFASLENKMDDNHKALYDGMFKMQIVSASCSRH
jgi:hypothetical protein